MLHSKHLHLRLFVYERNVAERGGRQENIQKLNIFLRVCIFMVSLHEHALEVRGGRCPGCVVAGTLFRHALLII